MSKKTSMIRKVYLYLVTAITIVILLVGFIGLINLLLKEYVLDVKGWQETEKYWECEQPGERDGLVLLVPEETVAVEPALAEGDLVSPVAEKANEKVKMTDNEMEKCIASTKAQREKQRMNDIKRDLAQYLAMILVALPLYLYHWGVIKKENE
ncbi:MAG: hypothetical protein GWP15_00415 [Nitrospirae bacterium]|nr:hypothetical protein [Nitrospirota bacterium]